MQVCNEHGCPEVPSLPLLSTTSPLPCYCIVKHQNSGDVLLSAERRGNTLVLIIHNARLEFKQQLTAKALCKVAELNARMILGIIVLDQSSGKALVVGYFIAGTAFESEEERKRRLCEYIRRLCAEWKTVARKLAKLIETGNRAELNQRSPSFPAKNSSSTEELQTEHISAEVMTMEIQNFQRSQDRSTQWQFTVTSHILTVLAVLFGGSDPFVIPEDQPIAAFATLALRINSKLKVAAFHMDCRTRHVHLVCHLPYSVLSRETVQTVLRAHLDSLASTYNLYFPVFEWLIRPFCNQEVSSPVEELLRPAEAFGAENQRHIDLHPTPKTLYFTRRVLEEEFCEEGKLYQDISVRPGLRELIQGQTVTFSEDLFEVSCSLPNALPIDLYFQRTANEPQTPQRLALIQRYMHLIHPYCPCKDLIDMVFVQDGKVCLRLWKLQKFFRANSQGPELVLNQAVDILTGKFDWAVINCDAIQGNENELLYEGQKVRLKSLRPEQSKGNREQWMFMLQFAAPKLCNLPSFQHIKGCCELKEGRWGLEPGLYRVELDISPNIPELTRQKAAYLLSYVGTALMDLHSKGYRCMYLSPSTIAFHNQQCVFLQCAMNNCTLKTWEGRQLDVRFLAPETVELCVVTTDSSEKANYPADYYSFALLMYALLVNPRIYEECPEPLSCTSAHLQVVHQLYRDGVRPHIPEDFKEAYPLISRDIRLGLEDSSSRPSIQDMMNTLAKEMMYTLITDMETYDLSIGKKPA